MGEEFSKKALERHRKDGKPLKCKQCVAAAEQEERDRAQAKREQQSAATGGDADGDDETRKCAGKCGQVISKSAFNRNQWMKGEGKSRCRTCVEAAVKEEAEQQSKTKEDKIAAARKKVEEAQRSKNPAKIVAAESELAALEAEKVTGLKPVKLSSGRGRGRGGFGSGRGRGRGRGRGK